MREEKPKVSPCGNIVESHIQVNVLVGVGLVGLNRKTRLAGRNLNRKIDPILVGDRRLNWSAVHGQRGGGICAVEPTVTWKTATSTIRLTLAVVGTIVWANRLSQGHHVERDAQEGIVTQIPGSRREDGRIHLHSELASARHIANQIVASRRIRAPLNVQVHISRRARLIDRNTKPRSRGKSQREKVPLTRGERQASNRRVQRERRGPN